MDVEIVLRRRRNDPDRWECWMRDPKATPSWSLVPTVRRPRKRRSVVGLLAAQFAHMPDHLPSFDLT